MVAFTYNDEDVLVTTSHTIPDGRSPNTSASSWQT